MEIKKQLKKMLLTAVPEFIKYEVKKPYLQTNQSYSQEGEDLILNRLLGYKKSGFYIDIGAHHPYRFSNTYLFYRKGWRGINIDAMPGSMQLFKELRSEDINVEVGIGKERATSTFYIFNEPALNTFSKAEAMRRDNQNGYILINKQDIQIDTLSTILDKYLPKKQFIDFMSVDVEGKDLEVLVSNNWEKYRPSYLLVEDLQRMMIEDITVKSELHKFLTSVDYQLTAKSYNTLFYKNIL